MNQSVSDKRSLKIQLIEDNEQNRYLLTFLLQRNQASDDNEVSRYVRDPD